MPAQLFPLVNDIHNALMYQRMMNYQQIGQYREGQLALREQALQNQQQMEPLRQQLMAAELQRTKAGIADSMRASDLREQMAPYEQQRLSAETQRIQDEGQSSRMRDALELHRSVREDKMADALTQTRDQELANRQQDMHMGLASHVSLLAGQPFEQKKPALDYLMQNGLISQRTHDDAVNAQIDKDQFADKVRQAFGSEKELEFRQLEQRANQKESNDERLEAQAMRAKDPNFMSDTEQARLQQLNLFNNAVKLLDRRSKGLNGVSDKPMAFPKDESDAIPGQIYQNAQGGLIKFDGKQWLPADTHLIER